MANNGKKRYTPAEKRAYYRGQGYAAAKAGKKVNCKTDAEKASCSRGYKSGKGQK